MQLAFRVGPVMRKRIGGVVKTRHLEDLDNALRHDILNPQLATSKVLHFAASLTVKCAMSGGAISTQVSPCVSTTFCEHVLETQDLGSALDEGVQLGLHGAESNH